MRILLSLALSCLLLSQRPSFAQSCAPQQPSTAPRNPSTAEVNKKLWTNENISSIHGTISVVGASSTLAEGHSSSGQEPTSNVATILSPPNGTLVHPGETIQIEATLDRGVSPVKGIGVISDIGFSNLREAPPYSFTFTIPREQPSCGGCRLLGIHTLTVFGTVVGRKNFDLASIEVDVEEPDLPIDLIPVGNYANQPGRAPATINFFWMGMDEHVDIEGRFPDGLELDVTESTYLTYLSGNPAIARVSEHATVTSIGPGETMAVFVYTLSTKQKQLFIPVHVEASKAGLVAKPSFIDFGDQPIDIPSAPQTISLTNNSGGPIQTYDPGLPNVFGITGDCFNVTLPAGGSCTINFVFTPFRRGAIHDNLNLPNSGGQFGIAISGNGV